MAEEYFDVDRLAAYLHMMPARVAKLADRGKLPGRRVSGEWRFARADIHHWLEDRMGLSGDDELAEMEGILERSAGPDDETSIKISELVHVDAVAIPLDARTGGSVVKKMTDLVAATGMLWDSDKMAEAIRDRESMHSTALDNGVALLHPRRPMSNILSEAVLGIGIVPSGVPFGGSRGLTDVFFLICSTSDHEHLRILARLSRIINEPQFLSDLRNATDAAQVVALLVRRESEID